MIILDFKKINCLKKDSGVMAANCSSCVCSNCNCNCKNNGVLELTPLYK